MLHMLNMLLLSYELYFSIAVSIGIGFFYSQSQQSHHPKVFKGPITFSLFTLGALLSMLGSARLLNDSIQFLTEGFDIFYSGDRANGIVFYGGFLGLVGFSLISARLLRLPHARLFDTLAIPLCFAHALGRLGCFVRGCCYGEISDLPWGVTHWTHHVPTERHPVQAYELFILLTLSSYLWAYRKTLAPGRRFARYLWMYAAARFVLEFFRGDSIRGIFYGLSTSQWIAIFLFLTGILLDFVRLKHDNRLHENRN